jgi:DNA-binding CsgD family transcriptional regulator
MTVAPGWGYVDETRSKACDKDAQPGTPHTERGICPCSDRPPRLPEPIQRDQDLAAIRAFVDEVAARLLLLYPVVRPAALEPTAGGDARPATAVHPVADVTGDLRAREALLADARRACARLGSAAETSLANALVLLHEDGDASAAYRLLLRAAQGVRDEGAGRAGVQEILWSLVAACRFSGRVEHRNSLERYISDSGPVFTPSVRTAARAILDPGAAPGWLREQIESLDDQDEPAEIVRIAEASAFTGDLPDCRQALRRAARPEPAGRRGVPGVQAGILLALEAYQTGQWDEAGRLAEIAADQCATDGYQLLRRQAQTVLAFVAACRGDSMAALEIADEIARWAAPRGLTSLLAGAHYACVLTALAQSDFPRAYQQAAKIGPAGDTAGEPFAAWALLDFVEAALRADRRGDADAHVRAARKAGLGEASPRMALVSTAAMAMTAPDEQAPALFELALAGGDAARYPFDRARVHLLAGERLRRVRAVGPARAHLGAAYDGFRRLGAPTWADRAAVGLRAVGQVPPGADNRGHQVLTAHELKIARLAAAGLSNKEIGDRLFMSHRTVASHLYRMFPRLGITSRAALGALLQPATSEGELTVG